MVSATEEPVTSRSAGTDGRFSFHDRGHAAGDRQA